MSTLETIRADLDSADEELRYQAVRAAQALNPVALREALTPALADNSWRVRKQAVAVLARALDDQAAWDLVQLGIADTDNAGHRAAALELLGELLPRLWPRVLELSRDPNPALRKFALDAVAARPSAEALGLLEERVGEQDANVRAVAIEVLGRIDHASARALLRRVVDERGQRDALELVAALRGLVDLHEVLPRASLLPLLGDALLRAPALQLLARCPEPDVVDVLVAALDPRSPSKARAAALGLAERGRRSEDEQRAVSVALRRSPELPAALRVVFQSHSHVDARAACALAGWLGDAELVGDLYALRRGRWVERELMEALRRCGPTRAAALSARLDRMEPADQLVAIDALAAVGDDAALDPVERLLRFGRGQVAEAAARCLGEAGASRRREVLERMLSDSDTVLAAACRLALEHLSARHGLGEPGRESSLAASAPGPARVAPAAEGGLVAPLSRGTFHSLRELIGARTGIFYADDAVERMEMRLRPRLIELGLPQFDAYLRLLAEPGPASDAEYGALVERITTHETYFFREKHQLDAFEREVLPELHERRARDRRLRIWSAGCASGEEVYTLAMLILDSGRFADWSVEIIGSDIAATVVGRARQGVYGDNSFRDPDRAYLERHFEAQGVRFRVREHLRRLVHFNVLNLLDAKAVQELPLFDAIFCRNVLIYFHSEAKLQLVETFHRMLRPGGYLMLGHAESLLNLSTAFEVVPLKTDLVYRRPVAGGAA